MLPSCHVMLHKLRTKSKHESEKNIPQMGGNACCPSDVQNSVLNPEGAWLIFQVPYKWSAVKQ